MFGKRLHSREELINRSGKNESTAGQSFASPPFWLLLPTAVSKQIEADRVPHSPSWERKQRLEGVAENGDKWTCETEGRGY